MRITFTGLKVFLFQVYNGCLEDATGFDHFNDFLLSLPLSRGKATEGEAEMVGEIKVLGKLIPTLFQFN